ncbi:hypothetical protein ASPSYDRAFT_1145805 [Aspergillus sydowii CBS 593.65]|uniref:Uncharacterized protein n=1 Tax=Aspergillus sydowii CBS 593.65 TaxID=1036612 RepID=A0A1L9TB24_9EURO|nr:uncharacterized protein ASPSYDRAFT_1145805 [Aspergillus sydowii CBS 593.65]OJJ56565.1 hypothetical protein ASPSYDRAFT_1145805 [Aspergillus sydowii CBS 593.65]
MFLSITHVLITSSSSSILHVSFVPFLDGRCRTEVHRYRCLRIPRCPVILSPLHRKPTMWNMIRGCMLLYFLSISASTLATYPLFP